MLLQFLLSLDIAITYFFDFFAFFPTIHNPRVNPVSPLNWMMYMTNFYHLHCYHCLRLGYQRSRPETGNQVQVLISEIILGDTCWGVGQWDREGKEFNKSVCYRVLLRIQGAKVSHFPQNSPAPGGRVVGTFRGFWLSQRLLTETLFQCIFQNSPFLLPPYLVWRNHVLLNSKSSITDTFTSFSHFWQSYLKYYPTLKTKKCIKC